MNVLLEWLDIKTQTFEHVLGDCLLLETLSSAPTSSTDKTCRPHSGYNTLEKCSTQSVTKLFSCESYHCSPHSVIE